MSLSQPSDGLLLTHVTWSDVELDMQEALGTVATFGPNKTIKNIGEGNGFMSRICLIEPDWQNGDESLPKKFVAKIISQLTLLEFTEKMEKLDDQVLDNSMAETMEAKCRMSHNVEVHMYELIEKYGRDKIPCSKIYKTRRFSEENNLKGYLLMEYAEDLVPIHLIDNLKPEDIKQVLKGVAVLERITFEMTEEEKEFFPKNLISEFLGQIFRNDNVTNMMLDALEKFGGAELEEQMKKLREVLPNVMEDSAMIKLDSLSKELGMTPVLCHTDLWSTNMLWKKPDGKLNLHAIIDFQTAHIGCAAADLGRFLCSALGGKDRREHWEELVEVFYGYVKEEMADNVPYTLEQLKESYLRCLPFASFFVVAGIPTMLQYINAFRDGEERDVTLESVMEKVQFLIEDINSGYERNLAVEKSTH